MTDLAELFSRDPLTLTREDLTQIVEEFRKKRGQFKLGNVNAGSTKAITAKQKEALSIADKLGGLDL